MKRKTKIVATLGPASDSPEVLSKLLSAGVNVVRINFSHGEADDHRERVRRVREAAAELQLPVAVLADLQGPKIRIESFIDGAVELETGQPFTLDTQMAANAGTREQLLSLRYDADVSALMAAELAHYPPCPQPDVALYPAARDRRAVAA